MSEASPTDALSAAMDRYACGDDAAFVEVHRGLCARLSAFLTRLTGSSTLAADLAQETFLRMHRARASFARGAAVVPWAYAIARNVHLDHARSAKLRRTERLPSDPGSAPIAPDDVESSAVARETAARVERVLAALPASQRDAFVLLRYEGLSVHDAAAVLGATPTAVKLRAFRAYEALRAELGDLRRGAEAGGANERARGDARTAEARPAAPGAGRRAGARPQTDAVAETPTRPRS